MADGDEEIRCFCAHKPLLAKLVMRRRRLVLHVRVYKAQRTMAEIEMTYGSSRIKCRECGRWHTVTIKKGEAQVISPNGNGHAVAFTKPAPVS